MKKQLLLSHWLAVGGSGENIEAILLGLEFHPQRLASMLLDPTVGRAGTLFPHAESCTCRSVDESQAPPVGNVHGSEEAQITLGGLTHWNWVSERT